MKKIDLMMHPARMRIILTIVGRQLTAREIGVALPDLPQATLYRQLNTLTSGGMLRVVEERQIRGAIERVYALSSGHAGLLTQDDLPQESERLMQLFMIFTATLLDSFGRYVQRPEINMERDMAGFRQVPLHATGEELLAALQTVSAALLPLITAELTPERRRYIFSTILLPEDQLDPGAEATGAPNGDP